jgi:hypothetical protein
MDNKTALFLGLAIVALLVLDALVLHWNLPLQLTRRLTQLIEVVAFWR